MATNGQRGGAWRAGKACRRLAAACTAVVLGAGAGAFEPPGGTPLAPQLSVLVLDRALLAVAAEGGGQREARLELGEQVLWTGSRGRVGVALTDRRVLAVTSRSAAWQDTRYRRSERPPAGAVLGDRVALVLTGKRVLGFDGGSGNLIEGRLGPRERVLAYDVGENVLVVVTDRRALGLSPFRGGFFETQLRLGESIENLAAESSHAVLTTSQRLLVFRGPFGSWEERRLGLH